jgi:surface polysaccharide O-acyltransferase-like enzyme
MTDRQESIDTMKCIAAFLVVCIHVTTPIPYFTGILINIARIAVPFFFICSGFFIYTTDQIEFDKKINRSIIKSAKLLLYFILVYFFVNTICWLDIRQIQEGLQLLASWDFWFFNITPFCPVAWYLMAYIYSLLFIKLILFISLTRHVFFKLCYVLIPAGLCYWLISGAYQSLFFDNIISWNYNTCWITSYPFVMFGIIIRNYQKILIQKINVKNSILYCLIIIFFITSVFAHYVLKKTTGNPVNGTGYISTILLVLVIFIFLLKNNHWGAGTIWNIIGKKYSLYIYLLHVAVNYILCRLFLVKFDFQHYFSFEPVIDLPFSYLWIINSFTVFFISVIIAKLLTTIKLSV